MKKKYTAIELFAGAGGMSLGFEAEGFNVRVASDFDKDCAETHRFNQPESKFLCDSIQKLTYKDFLKEGKFKVGEIDVMAGGPPCQGFSINAPQRNIGDPRNSLFRHYVRLVSELKPKFVVLENVPGMLSLEGGEVAKNIVKAFEEIGYKMDFKILFAPDFGVPQERRRVIFLGNRIGVPVVFPEPTHYPLGSMLKPWYVTVEEAIGDLPNETGNKGETLSYPTKKGISKYAREMREGSKVVKNHGKGILGEKNLQRIKHIPPGGSWRDIPYDLLPAGMQKAKRSDHTKRYGRLHPNGLASTILTKCDPHWGAYIHYSQERTISVREAARFQGFPDRYEFLGSTASQYIQVGNAVPVPLARAIARAIKKNL
ncbi:MAG: DNA cytosine methyltransferase [Candidatus Moraniibacteriota bacterium]|nr:MAG: DNA cytosine methyltransferase [Candidatus Moranbacteria bacterium]